jgi:hypothetical protein
VDTGSHKENTSNTGSDSIKTEMALMETRMFRQFRERMMALPQNKSPRQMPRGFPLRRRNHQSIFERSGYRFA